MRTTKLLFYNSILLQGRRINAPSMKEARRDLDRAFFAVRLGAIAA